MASSRQHIQVRSCAFCGSTQGILHACERKVTVATVKTVSTKDISKIFNNGGK